MSDNNENEKQEQSSGQKLIERLTQELCEQHTLFHDTQKQPYKNGRTA